MEESNLCKLIVELDENDWHSCSTESVWAEKISFLNNKSALLRILNTPFYAKGLSFLDLVQGSMMDESMYQFSVVTTRSGHSTYRVIVLDESRFDAYWEKLSILKCTYESGYFDNKPIYAIDVPKETNIREVYALLEKGEKEKIWMFDEGYCAHINSKENMSKH